jgi:hypothetical protein
MDVETFDSDLINKLTVPSDDKKPFNTLGRTIPDNTKILFEMANLDNLNPTILNNVSIIMQEKTDWKLILESKMSALAIKFQLSTVR